MKNIKDSNIELAIKITDNNGDYIYLSDGDYVKIKTDNTNFREYYEGVIENLTEDGFSISSEEESEYEEFITWEYIEEIN